MPVTAKEALYNLINRTNDVEYSDANVVLSAPSEHTLAELSTKNTSVLVTGRSSANKTGTVRLYYDRVNIRTIVGTAPVVIAWDNELRIVDLIPKLNAQFGIHLVDADVVDNALPPKSEGSINFSFVMSSGSYGWLGNFTVSLSIDPGDVEDETGGGGDQDGLDDNDLT